MLTRFFTPAEVIDYFEEGELKKNLLNGETIAICSIADLLDVCEAYKKGNLDIFLVEELGSKLDAFNEGPVKEGVVSIVDLDQNNLSAALFERDSGVVIDLWRQAANRDVSPKRSIRYLTLRVTDDSIWWSENVYQEMEEYHTAQDE